jgi:hypothetical protein
MVVLAQTLPDHETVRTVLRKRETESSPACPVFSPASAAELGMFYSPTAVGRRL